jgi:predicted protein tyrosine phosphatase
MGTINVLFVGEAFMAYTERPPMRQSVTFHDGFIVEEKKRKERLSRTIQPRLKKELQSCQIQECERKENLNKLT